MENVEFKKRSLILKVVAIIPARMASSRFPGKPLADILGLPMVEHVRRRVCLCRQFSDVIVATCDIEIQNKILRLGGKCIMTSDKHQGCIDRVAEAALKTKADVVINVQGDLPLIHPQSLKNLIAPFKKDKKLLCADMMGPIARDCEIANPNVIKVVVDKKNNALYYSREPIPSNKKAAGCNIPYYKQFGVNAFRKNAIKRFTSFSRCLLENIESVDMLRALGNGWKVKMVLSEYPNIGVDTQDDLRQAEAFMKKDNIYPLYKNKRIF